MLNTILYNSDEGIKDEVNKRLRKTATTIITSTTKPSIRDNVHSVLPTIMPYLTEN